MDNKVLSFITCVIIAAVLTAAPGYAGDWDDDWEDNSNGEWNDSWEGGGGPGSGLDLSGYFETRFLAGVPRDGDFGELTLGLQNLIRIRGNVRPSDSFSITLEADYRDGRGAANPIARMGLTGFPLSPEAVAGSAEYHNAVTIDYAYVSAALGPLDLRIGRQPVVWGTAYAFNPTDLSNSATMAGLAGIEPPGLTAINAALTFGTHWGLDAYVGFEERTRGGGALMDWTDPAKLPFGVRGRAFIGAWDFAVGIARSAWTSASNPAQLNNETRITGEIAGSLGPVSLYAEGAIETDDSDWSVENSVDAAAGVVYEAFSFITIQLEYHRRGRGAESPELYDPLHRIAGGLAARDYLVTVANFGLFDDKAGIMTAALTNLNDGSSVILPEASWNVTDDFQISLGSSVFLGGKDTEFDGRFTLPDALGGAEVDIGRPQVFLKAVWYY